MRSQNEPVPYANTNQASWGSIQLGWGGTIVVFSQNNGIQLDIYIISYYILLGMMHYLYISYKYVLMS